MELDKIPGLVRAVERAQRVEDGIRDGAFLPSIVGEEICGVPVVQLTLRRLRVLLSIHSPFLVGKVPTGEDVARFLWIVSEQFGFAPSAPPPQTWLAKLRRRPAPLSPRDRLTRSIARLPYLKACRAINRYLDRALLDRPTAQGGTRFPVSFDAYLVHVFAKSYGWTEDAILDAPLARLFQYLRLIRREDDPKAPQISRLSDRVRARKVRLYLEQMQGTAAAPPTASSDAQWLAGEISKANS